MADVERLVEQTRHKAIMGNVSTALLAKGDTVSVGKLRGGVSGADSISSRPLAASVPQRRLRTYKAFSTQSQRIA